MEVITITELANSTGGNMDGRDGGARMISRRSEETK